MTVLACGHDDYEGSGICAVCGVTPTSDPAATAASGGGGGLNVDAYVIVGDVGGPGSTRRDGHISSRIERRGGPTDFRCFSSGYLADGDNGLPRRGTCALAYIGPL